MIVTLKDIVEEHHLFFSCKSETPLHMKQGTNSMEILHFKVQPKLNLPIRQDWLEKSEVWRFSRFNPDDHMTIMYEMGDN